MDIYLSHSSALEIWSSFKTGADVLARCWDSRNPSWRKDEPLPSECKVTELLIRELAGMPELEGIALPPARRRAEPSGTQQMRESRLPRELRNVSQRIVHTHRPQRACKLARALLRANGFGAVASRADQAWIRAVRHVRGGNGWKSGLPVRTPLHHPRPPRTLPGQSCEHAGNGQSPKSPQAPRRRLRLPDGNDLGHAALPPASHGRVRPSPALHEPRREPSRAIEARSR